MLCSPFLCQAQDMVYTQKVLRTLCSKEYAGRGYINNGLGKAAEFISKELKKSNISPLLATGYYQFFDMNVNTFPDKMELSINNKKLIPGQDFIVAPYSLGLNWNGTLFDKKDSVTFASKEVPLLISLKKKLTFSVATGYEKYSAVEVLDTNHRFDEIKKVQVHIENKFLTKYICKNIIASIEGTTQNDSFIVFTAHYDHLGMMGKATYFPGANDNASGVSMLLNLIKHYKKQAPKYKTIFVFFAGEEAGLLGSQYFVEHPPIALSKIKFLINLDLLGTGSEGITVVNATEFKKQFDLLAKINHDKKYMPQIKQRGKAHNSDHYWFTEKGVPSFFIYTLGGIKAYHDIYDVPKTLPLTKYQELFHLLLDFAEQVSVL